MTPNPSFRANPSRLYLYPLLLGLVLMAFSILAWYYPGILLFLVLAPVFLTGLGLVLFGLDIWHGIPNWRQKVTRATFSWRGDDDR